MEKMSYILRVSLFYICMVLVALAQNTHEDVGEYGHHNTRRKSICEKNNQEMYEEMDACFKMEHENVQNATEECSKEAHPPSEGKIISFVNAACNDTSVFIKFDTCFEKYEANSTFREQMELTPEIEACYVQVMKKYQMDDL